MNMNRADDVSNMNGLDNVGGANDIDGRNEVSETNDMKCRQMAQTIHGRSRYGHELVGMLWACFLWRPSPTWIPAMWLRILHPARGTVICWCGCWYSPIA